MKLLDGRDLASYIKQRHVGQVAALSTPPKLAIIRSQANEAGDRYLKMKRQYGQDIGATVDFYVETPATLLERIQQLNDDVSVTGIIIQLPLGDAELTVRAVAAVAPAKDIDGLAPHTMFEGATPKAILWLLAAHNVDILGTIVIVGQGRLVGKPLADRLAAAGHHVIRCDIHTKDLAAATIQADILFTGTGQPRLITSSMVKQGAVLVDTGAPAGELDPVLYQRKDLTITPNPGGVGPVTVAALFDNLMIAAQR